MACLLQCLQRHLVHFAILFCVDRPEMPQNLMAVNLTSRNFTLTWVEPHDNNAPIDGYMYVTHSPLTCMIRTCSSNMVHLL